jgi:hypothetical protein
VFWPWGSWMEGDVGCVRDTILIVVDVVLDDIPVC